MELVKKDFTSLGYLKVVLPLTIAPQAQEPLSTMVSKALPLIAAPSITNLASLVLPFNHQPFATIKSSNTIFFINGSSKISTINRSSSSFATTKS
jgi:hypothetical protein